jgi:hypothetical protein
MFLLRSRRPERYGKWLDKAPEPVAAPDYAADDCAECDMPTVGDMLEAIAINAPAEHGNLRDDWDEGFEVEVGAPATHAGALDSKFSKHPRQDGPRSTLSLEDLPHGLAVANHVADRAIVTLLGLLDRVAVGPGEDVLLLDDDAVRLGQLVDPVQFHHPTLMRFRENLAGHFRKGRSLGP